MAVGGELNLISAFSSPPPPVVVLEGSDTRYWADSPRNDGHSFLTRLFLEAAYQGQGKVFVDSHLRNVVTILILMSHSKA